MHSNESPDTRPSPDFYSFRRDASSLPLPTMNTIATVFRETMTIAIAATTTSIAMSGFGRAGFP